MPPKIAPHINMRREEGDAQCHRGGDRTDEDVAVADMRQFVREDPRSS